MMLLRKISWSQGGMANDCPAFTLTELMVVIGVVMLLAVMLLPALAQSKMKSQAVVCLSHMRQLQRGALLYASDNNDECPKNYPLSGVNSAGTVGGVSPCWVYGTFGSPGAAPRPADAPINPFYLGVNGLTGGNPVVTLWGSIGPYVKSAEAYRCPADYFIDPRYHVLRVRSCSANMYIGSVSGLPGIIAGYKIFQKYSDFGGVLNPSQCFEFLDENPISLIDGYFDYAADGSYNNDWPAANHDLAASFSYTDGHTELHRWHDVFLKPYPAAYTASGTDTLWLAQHGTYKLP